MNPHADVIIIGSGPAGVSAALPLLERGWSVLMLDGGSLAKSPPIKDSYLELRKRDPEQWRWMLGENYHSLQMRESVSPKLRVPSLSYTFDGFTKRNRIASDNFVAVGSLSQGGLSNAWGAGVARFSNRDLEKFPLAIGALDSHYDSVLRRIGVSGQSPDDLADYFGVDNEADPAFLLDDVNADFFRKYSSVAAKTKKIGFALGRSRVAVLNRNLNERSQCNYSGNCLWGCARKSIYSAAYDLDLLKQKENFRMVSGFVVDRLEKEKNLWRVIGESNESCFYARRVILACGTLATTRLALSYLQYHKEIQLLSSPTAAFVVWNYKRFGVARKPGFGLGQLSYTLDYNEQVSAFGSTFSTVGIPVSEFVNHAPLVRPAAIDVMSVLLSSCTIGNLFLPGHLTNAKAILRKDGYLSLEGGYTPEATEIFKSLAVKLRKSFWMLGGLVLPGSFTVGKPGSDIHYAGTLPMRHQPALAECFASGELAGAEELYIADGASLSYLPEKSHTLTIMANAERIGTLIASLPK